ncbi:uncharacterized protein LOC143299066 isoform X3 [Babylonia areolata]|uniref:uncharacterized protein LOC143299066 isoform X1 n=1 Tax=Babylonia areolata TaxID=304850 RepID=UPI003FD5DB08
MASQSHHTLPGPGEGGGGGGGGGGGKRRSFLPAPTKRTSGIPTPSSSSVLTPSPSISAPPLSSQVPAPPSATAQPPGRSLKASSGEAPPRGGPARDDEVSNKPPVEVIPGAEKLRVGERILISGVKPGILRFVGRTHIAPGFWCGIELHDASGLHDGEVDGQRYFTCKPFRGIFAPVDKVGPDETQPKVVLPPSLACAAEEKRTQLPSGQSKHSENMECSGKPGSAGKSGSGSGSGKYQGSRLAGVFRRGAESPDKGGGGEPSCKASAYNRRSFGGVGEQDRDGGSYYKSRMSSSYSDYHDHHRHQQESARAGSEEAEGYSSHVKEHLQSDSRRYFNLTFGRDTPPYLTNLPDLLSSVNPPSPKEDAAAEAGQQPHGGAVRSVSDVHLSFKEGGMEEDSGGFLLESSPPGAGRGVPSASESDASLSGQSSTLEDASVATVSEVPRAAADLPPTTTKAPGPSSGEDGKLVEASDRCRSRSPAAVTHGGMARTGGQGGEQRKEDDPRQTARHHHHHHQRAGSTSGAGGGTREGRVVVMEEGGGQEDGSNEVSPEVSQVLEWDYDHDAFDGKLLEKGQDGMSTSTSESCSESSATGAVGGVGGAALLSAATTATDKTIPELDAPAPFHDGGEHINHNHEFEENDDGFETIDNIADFPLGMGREGQHLMTDSGIFERADFQDEEVSKRKSVEFDSKVRVVVRPSPAAAAPSEEGGGVGGGGGGGGSGGGGGVVVAVLGGGMGSGESRLQEDLVEGHRRQERPLSLLSTASGDTGYVADTDTEEAGTLTANSPLEGIPPGRQAPVPEGGGGVGVGVGSGPTAPRGHGALPPPSSSSSSSVTSITPTTTTSSAATTLRPNKQGRGSAGVPLRAVAVVGQDLNREDVAILDDRDSLEKQLFDGESEESEEGDDDDEDEEEEEEETSEEEEEETTSEEEEESSEEEEEESEEESDDGESEDDRIEADRNAPNARNSAKGGQEGRVAVPVAGGENLAMAGSAVVSSEMTESSDTVSLSQKQGHDSTTTTTATTTTSTEGAPPKPQPTTTSSSSTSQKPDHPASSTTTTTTSAGPSKKPKKKPKSTPNSAEDKKIVAEHKKAIKKASSRLADYIKAPLPPPKPKEEKPDARSSKKNKDKKSSSSSSKAKKKQDKADKEKKKKKAAGNKDEEEEKKEEKKERRQPRVREEKPKVKRTVVKSKWGNIMSQIEASKQTVKIKPKTEIQSSLALYLSTPAPPNPNKKEDSPEGGKEGSPHPNQPTSIKAPSKPKPKLIKHPKPDFSNIKSKLNITPPPPLPRRDSNANNSGGNLKSPNTTPKGSCSSNKGSLPGSPKDPGGKASEGARSRTNVSRKPPVPKFNSKEFAEREAAQSQGTGSCSSLTGVDGNAVSRAGARLRSDRGSSVTSTKSDNSATQRSVKSMNQRNVQKTEQAASGSDPADSRKTPVKSSSLPPSGSKKAVGEGGGGGGGARPTTTTTTTTSSTTSTPSRPARGSGATRKGSVDHHQQQPRPPSGPRAALQGGLKSGHPPDVVSTSARGPRAQEVARLESLCEARTKELGLARAQLRSGVQAFDAMACLLNYCTTELDAFSCPVISAKLKKATDTLGQQQQSLDQLTQEKSVAEQQLQETRAARDAARQEVEQLREEMRTAADTHGAAQQRLQEEQAAALRALREEISSQHQDTLQKMQQYQENQAEYNRQSHRRQLVEVTSEHQMATNQLKVAHLEEIQELRNKHELQVEELHAQHRKKLEDITERFESIKLSLTEKVQSLCSECDDLRIRAKTSEDALQRDSDVKVQLALTPYLHLPQEIESLKTVIDMRTEEIQKLKRQNMDLVKQLEELPIAQEKVVSLKQKVENLQAIINIKTDHEKQLHEKCQVLMRKYDRESRAKKRLSMDYEQVVWRMSQSADLGGSSESVGAGASPRQLSRSPSRGSQHSPHGASPVRSLSSSSGQGADSNGGGVGVVRRQRKTSGGGGEEADQRRRANTFSSDTPRHRHVKRDDGDGDDGLSGPASLGYVSTTSSSSTGKRRVLSKSGDYSELVSVAAARERERREREREREQHEESFSSGHESGDTSDFFSSLESNVILETAQGVSFQLLDKAEAGGGGGGGAPPPSYPQPTPAQDEVFAEEMVVLHAIQDMSPPEEVTTSSSSSSHTITTTTTTTPTQVKDTDRQAEVTVVVTTASSQ